VTSPGTPAPPTGSAPQSWPATAAPPAATRTF
jgi:hypothetical protein